MDLRIYLKKKNAENFNKLMCCNTSLVVVLEVDVFLAELGIQFSFQLDHDDLNFFDSLLDAFNFVLLLLLGFLQQRLRFLDVVVDEDLADKKLNLIVVQQLDLLNRLFDVCQLVLLVLQFVFEFFDFRDVIGELIDSHLIGEGNLNVGIGILQEEVKY